MHIVRNSRAFMRASMVALVSASCLVPALPAVAAHAGWTGAVPIESLNATDPSDPVYAILSIPITAPTPVPGSLGPGDLGALNLPQGYRYTFIETSYEVKYQTFTRSYGAENFVWSLSFYADDFFGNTQYTGSYIWGAEEGWSGGGTFYGSKFTDHTAENFVIESSLPSSFLWTLGNFVDPEDYTLNAVGSLMPKSSFRVLVLAEASTGGGESFMSTEIPAPASGIALAALAGVIAPRRRSRPG